MVSWKKYGIKKEITPISNLLFFIRTKLNYSKSCFWVIITYRVTGLFRRFGKRYCLHVQSDWVAVHTKKIAGGCFRLYRYVCKDCVNLELRKVLEGYISY
jgi:hypothetical protein